MATKTRLTADDLWNMRREGVRQELVDGHIDEMPPSNALHGKYVIRIGALLEAVVYPARNGEVVGGDVGFVLNLPYDPERVRCPDVAFISRGRIPADGLPERFFSGAPDLAVEVLSPSDDPVDVQQKIRDWLEGGARQVWIVAGRAKTVTVYRSDGSARLLRESDVLEGEDVVPGLSIPLRQLFE